MEGVPGVDDEQGEGVGAGVDGEEVVLGDFDGALAEEPVRTCVGDGGAEGLPDVQAEETFATCGGQGGRGDLAVRGAEGPGEDMGAIWVIAEGVDGASVAIVPTFEAGEQQQRW